MWKRQPDGRIDRRRNVAGQHDAFAPFLKPGSGIGIAESSACVYGCSGLLVERVAVGELDDLADVHHGDAGRDVPHDREVVRDEEIGQSELLLQILEQVDDLRLNRDVERRDRLVADDEFRIDRQRARDADALPLAAGELVRVAVGVVGLQSDELEQLADAFVDAPCPFAMP